MFSKDAEVALAIVVAQAGYGFLVYTGRYLRRIIDRVQVRNQRDCHPIVSGQALITADYDTSFARFAWAQMYWRIRADALQIKRGMASWIKSAKNAEGLLQ